MADNTMSTNEADRRGGHAQSKENNPGNFANDREKASDAGKKGAQNQPREAKAEGGRHSHRNATNSST